MTESFEHRHATLIREFNEYLFDHPEFAEQIPAGAILLSQVADDAEYNAWSRALAPRRSRLVNPHFRLSS